MSLFCFLCCIYQRLTIAFVMKFCSKSWKMQVFMANPWSEYILSGRGHWTEMNGCFSDILEVIHLGLIQGSCLSCLLFIIYVNDFFMFTKLFSLPFADDTNIVVKDKNFKFLLILWILNLKKAMTVILKISLHWFLIKQGRYYFRVRQAFSPSIAICNPFLNRPRVYPHARQIVLPPPQNFLEM